MTAPSYRGYNATTGSAQTTLALTSGSISGQLAVGDLVALVVLSTSYTSAAPTITNGVNTWDLDLDVQASGANQRAIFYSRVLTSSDFFSGLPLTLSGWASSGTIRVLAAGWRHANGFSSTASLRRYATASYNTASGGSGDYTVASFADCPNACVLLTAIGGGSTNAMTFKYDGGAATTPTWDESALSTGNQGGYVAYDAGASGPTSVVYTVAGNSNKAIGTLVYTANPDPKALSGKGSMALGGKGTIYRQQPITPVSGKASTAWAGSGRLMNPNTQKHSPGKGGIAWVGGGRMALIKRPITKTATAWAGKAARLVIRHAPPSKTATAWAGKGRLVRLSPVTAGRVRLVGMDVTATAGAVTVDALPGRIRFAADPADVIVAGQAVALPGLMRLRPSAEDPVIAGVLQRSGYRSASASAAHGVASHARVVAGYRATSASSGTASTNRLHVWRDSFRSASASGSRGLVPGRLTTAAFFRAASASAARVIGLTIAPTTAPGLRLDVTETYALDTTESYRLDAVDDSPQYGAP